MIGYDSKRSVDMEVRAFAQKTQSELGICQFLFAARTTTGDGAIQYPPEVNGVRTIFNL